MSANKDPVYCCPECGSSSVTTTEERKWMVNSGDHYCYSVKPHDDCAKADCLTCGWVGVRSGLLAGGE